MTRPDATIAAKGGGRTKAKQGTLRKRTAPDVRGGGEARAELGIQPGQTVSPAASPCGLTVGALRHAPRAAVS